MAILPTRIIKGESVTSDSLSPVILPKREYTFYIFNVKTKKFNELKIQQTELPRMDEEALYKTAKMKAESLVRDMPQYAGQIVKDNPV